MTANKDVIKTNWCIIGAWRAAQEPDVIAQAVRIGEQVANLLVEAATLIQRARWNVDLIIEDAFIRCQEMVDQLVGEVDRLTPVLIRLRAASKAVAS